jgi:hypothetical protein
MPMADITNVLAAAPSYDLTDLAAAKTELGVAPTDTSQDAWLTNAISQISAAISSYCNRVFPQETVEDIIYPARDAYPFQVPGGLPRLQLSRWPVATARVAISIASAVAEGATVLPVVSQTGLVAGMPVGGIEAADVLPSGTIVQAVNDDGTIALSHAITSALAGGSVLWAGPVVRVADPANVVRTLDPAHAYAIDARPGQAVRMDRFTGYPSLWYPLKTTVTYQGGFASIPSDVVDAALRLLTQRAASRDRDPMLKSRDQPGLGTETYWVGSVPGVKGAFPSEIAALLDTYRVPVIA